MKQQRKQIPLGSRYGHLTVISETYRQAGRSLINVRCDCGNVYGLQLHRWGVTEQCNSCRPVMVHGYVKIHHPLYSTWRNIKSRCNNSNSDDYSNYGGRGITIYPPWDDSFAAFAEWIYTNLTPRPDGMQLDRIDNDGNYEPGNLRWATVSENNRNRRDSTGLPPSVEHHAGKFRVRIYVGAYVTLEEAAPVAEEARRRLGMAA